MTDQMTADEISEATARTASDDVFEAPLMDSHGREHDYLRVSVTDRCNLRCTYCMPPDGIQHFSKDRVLSLEETLRVARVGVSMGIEKIRITGGEPLLRENVVWLFKKLSELDDLETLAMTTNGLLLEEHLDELRETQLSSINISLDRLDPEEFKEITRGGDIDTVLEALRMAVEAGFNVKVNAVALPDLTLEDVGGLAELARTHDIEMRFIEFMPLCGNAWQSDEFTPLEQLQEKVVDHFDLEPTGRRGVSNRFVFPDGRGSIGFIASLSDGFCDTCTRLRLSSKGKLRSCLFSERGDTVREILRSGGTDEEIAMAYRSVLDDKWEGNPAFTGEWDPEEEDPPQSFSLIRSIGG